MFFQRKLACSFCGKTAAQVAKLVAGRGVNICDACTAEAQRLMADSGSAPSSSTPPRASSLVESLRRLVRRSYRADRESLSMKPA